MMGAARVEPGEGTTPSPLQGVAVVWLGLGMLAFTLGLVLTWDPSFAGVGSTWWTVLPFVVLVSLSLSLADSWLHLTPPVKMTAVVITLAGSAALMLHDDRWTVLTFGLYALCFQLGRIVGIALAALVTLAWALAWIEEGEPGWRLLMPLAAFAVGAVLSAAIYRVGAQNQIQAELIEQLTATQQDLAVSERERGVLEERARFAGEIHDTLAQGFTSIVLLSRATRRNHDWSEGLGSIERTAEENLRAARRLVASLRPAELAAASLPDALQRQVSATAGDDMVCELAISGEPVPLAGSTEVTLLRAAQEALRNARTHARADQVHVTLSYVGDSVSLDVQDDGVGFETGSTADRGTLTGGQGLAALRDRTESLGGLFSIEASQGGGSVVSVQLPVSTS